MRTHSRGKSVKGETLIETIVSFAIVLMTMAVMTTIVQMSIRLNHRSAERAAELEERCSILEDGALGEGTHVLSSELVLTLPDNTTVLLPINVYSGDLLGWFAARDTGVY